MYADHFAPEILDLTGGSKGSKQAHFSHLHDSDMPVKLINIDIGVIFPQTQQIYCLTEKFF